MNGHVDINTLAHSLAQEQKQRDDLYISMGAAVKELVNLLLPADYIVTLMDQNAERIEGTDKVAVRRDELDSVVHLVLNAHALAARLRMIMSAAGLSTLETAPAAAPAPRSDAAPAPRPDAASAAAPRPDAAPARPRDDWRKDPREALRPVKAA